MVRHEQNPAYIHALPVMSHNLTLRVPCHALCLAAWQSSSISVQSTLSRTCWLEEFFLKIKKYKPNTKVVDPFYNYPSLWALIYCDFPFFLFFQFHWFFNIWLYTSDWVVEISPWVGNIWKCYWSFLGDKCLSWTFRGMPSHDLLLMIMYAKLVRICSLCSFYFILFYFYLVVTLTIW